MTVIPIKTKARNQRRRALFLRVGNQIESMIYQEFSNDSFTHNTFSGIVLMTRLNGDFIRAYRIKNNEYVIDLVPSKKAKSSQKTTMRENEVDVEYGLSEVVVYNRFKVSPGFVSLTNLANEVPISINWDPNYNGGGGTSGGFSVTVVEEEDFEDKIDDSELDPCTKAVLDKLKLGTVNDISTMVNRFDSGGSINNIYLKLGVTNPNNFAETSPVGNSKFDINIVLNQDYIFGTHFNSRPTNLSVATTLTHEIIHAYLVSIQNEFDTGCGTTICDFPSLFDAFIAYKSSKDPTILQDEHEELIATKYVNGIAETVQEFHTGIRVEKGMASEIYKDLALSGLYKTKYFTKTYPDDQNDVNYAARQRIIKRVHAERIGQNVGEISIVGNSCNK